MGLLRYTGSGIGSVSLFVSNMLSLDGSKLLLVCICLSMSMAWWMDFFGLFDFECAFAFSIATRWLMICCCVAEAVALDLCLCLSATCGHLMGQSCFQCALAFLVYQEGIHSQNAS